MTPSLSKMAALYLGNSSLSTRWKDFSPQTVMWFRFFWKTESKLKLPPQMISDGMKDVRAFTSPPEEVVPVTHSTNSMSTSMSG